MNAPKFSEQAIAFEVAKRYGDDWRFVADTKRWIHWNDVFWNPDLTNAITNPIMAICCENAKRAADEGAEPGLVRSLASDRVIRAVLNRLSTDQRLVLTQNQLDANRDLLGTPSGFIDLPTGKHYRPDRTKLITMRTSVEPASEGSESPLFAEFLNTTYPLPNFKAPDQEVIGFLKRYGGSSLTGHMNDAVFLFLIGSGGNGKGVLPLR